LRSLVTRLFEALLVEIWLWNLAHGLMRSNEILGYFLGSGYFLVPPRNFETCLFLTLSLTKQKFCRELCWYM
jgi:hypothetical protein